MNDDNFAKAFAALAFSYDLLSEFGYLSPDEAYPKLKMAAHRALEIDATTAEAHTALAVAATYYDRDWVRADERYRRALELNPNSAITHDYYGGIYLSPLGRYEEAIAHGRRAEELDPLTPSVRQDLGWTYLHIHLWDEGIAECKRALDIDPNFYFAYWCVGFGYWQKGLLQEAIAAYERGIELVPDDLQLKADLASVYVAAGDPKRARRIVEEIEEKAGREYVSPLAMAMAYMALDDFDSTFAWLDKMYEEHHPWLIYMAVQPRFDRLRGDPRFHELLRKIGLPDLKAGRPAS